MWFWMIVWLDIRKLLWQVCLLGFNMAWAQTGELWCWRVGCWLGVVVILSQPWLETPTIQIFKRFQEFQMRHTFSNAGKGDVTRAKSITVFLDTFCYLWLFGLRLPVILKKGIIKNEHVQTCGLFDYSMRCLLCCFGVQAEEEKKGKTSRDVSLAGSKPRPLSLKFDWKKRQNVLLSEAS